MTGMVRYGDGYVMVGEDGGIFSFSGQAFVGFLGDDPPAKPMTSVVVLDNQGPGVTARWSRPAWAPPPGPERVGSNFRHNETMPRKPSRPRAGSAAFPPLSDDELVEFLRELTGRLPGDLAETVTTSLDRGDDPGALARMVRNELRSRGHIPS